jgi:hypothetical protein
MAAYSILRGMSTNAADATLLIRQHCPYCPAVADALLRLTKDAKLARLDVINLDSRPEQATIFGARSVPWLQLGPFRFVGAQSYRELETWADHAAAGNGWPDYLIYLLSHQQLGRATELIESEPRHLSGLIERMADADLEMSARIGISALVEDFAGAPGLRACIPQLTELTLSAYPQIRADACHFIGLAGDASALPVVQRLLGDEQEDVREIALETLAVLEGTEAHGQGSS